MIVNREELLQKIESTRPGLSPKEIIEQGTCFIFTKKKVITYNDEISCSIECDIGIEGAVQAAPFSDILTKLEEDTVRIEKGEGIILVRGKKRRAGIRMEEEILLPIDKITNPEKWKKLPSGFAEAAKITQQCTSTDESKFHLACVHLTRKWIEACDNTQLIRYPMKLKIKKPILIRGDSMKHLVHLGMTHISESEEWVHFKNEMGLILSCRRYIEDYPDMSGFLEVRGEKAILPKSIKEAAEKANIFSSEDPEKNRVLISLRNGFIRVKGKGPSGWYDEKIKAKYDKDPVSFMISPKLLGDIVTNHRKCQISSDFMKIDEDEFTYVIRLDHSDE